MVVNDTIFKELIKRGYSDRDGCRVWDVSDSKLWYLTPELSQGFLKLKQFQPFRKNVVEKEIELIKAHAHRVAERFGSKKFNIVDLGCGGGRKAATFIESIPSDIKIRYCPLDISKFFLDKAQGTVKEQNFKNIVEFKPLLSSFDDLEEVLPMLRTSEFQNHLVLLFGETISHYEINDFLYQISNNLFQGDMLIIGNGIRTGERFVHVEKYKDSLFNEWFIQVVKGLGFEENEVEYDARFTEERLEGFYRIKVDKTISHKGKEVQFRKGDEVIVGIQYKYYKEELEEICGKYFRKIEMLPDEAGGYTLITCLK
jgi:uncharacterized SAM-dependent methyltransferase